MRPEPVDPRKTVRQAGPSFGLAAILALTISATVAMAQPPETDASRAPGLTPITRSATADRKPTDREAPTTTGGWWFGTAGIAVVLIGCGAVCLAARRYVPRESTPLLKVVGRVGLSPKHSVYLLKVEGRVLLIGTGPQGAPSYLGELEEPSASIPNGFLPEEEAAPPRAAATTSKPRTTRAVAARSGSRFDVQVGDEA